MNIFLIAGPPGIGKSTNAKELVPNGIQIIDQDLAGYQYKKQGFDAYQDLASLSTRQRIRELLVFKEDFALELNLGFQSHYDFLRSIASFDPANIIHLILFFTDDPDLCISRAKIRHVSGGHEVKQPVIEEMYQNTFPLFEQHRSLFHTVRLIDVTDQTIIEHSKKSLDIPEWINRYNVQAFLVD